MFYCFSGYIIMMSKQASRMCMNNFNPTGRTPHFPFSLCLCSPLPLRDLKTHDLYPSAKSQNLVWPRSQEFPKERLDRAGKFEASDESSVFMFILTATVGRNLFCLDQGDTLSSSHRCRRSQELDKEWNIWTNVCPATSSSVWTMGDITGLLCNPRQWTAH